MGYRKLLVVSCCAPCSCAAIKRLVEDGVEVTVLFYNPNIYPQAEYEKRRDEQAHVCRLLGAHFVELPYEPTRWEQAIDGLENEPERGERCSVCFYMRLQRAQEYAKAHHFDALTSVFGVSRYKDFHQVNRAARWAWIKGGKPYWAKDWRKDGLEELRRALIKEFGLYQQTYCGCKYSLSKANIHGEQTTK
ncbi:MAG: epoxyqueuosine reductase QueH [Elusimicrobiaceae bacterium]|nr:epoxyqueuosine reductase QueH [Elusimicrobiaceae bacterium]